ncbi:GD13110 [Drosophila simulans]|uniref:IST1 homolog n=1 Tax=Drosophila simulans TaxID=7240 RepID=B4QJT5_DROSI|nr:GD13110 [Drosophila simulans]
MFSSGPNYNKLKTNLRLALNRLKLLEKKKAELTQKSRKEIADYLATGKTERARIRRPKPENDPPPRYTSINPVNLQYQT